MNANSAAAMTNQIPVVFEFIIFSAPARPAAEQQHRAGQRAQQQPADFALLGCGHHQAEFRDGPRPDAFEQLVRSSSQLTA